MHLNRKRKMAGMSSTVKIFMTHLATKSCWHKVRIRLSRWPSQVSVTTFPVANLRTPEPQ